MRLVQAPHSASRPLLRTHDRVTALLEQASRQLLVDGVVFGHQDAQPPSQVRGRDRSCGAAPCAATGCSAQSASRIARAARDWLNRLRQIAGDAQLAAARGVAALSGRREHHDARRRPARGRLANLLGQREAVHRRASARRCRTSGNGRPSRRALRRAECAAAPPPTTVGPIPSGSQSRQDAAVGRVVVHDQHRQPCRSTRCSRPRLGTAGSARPKRAVKWKVLPCAAARSPPRSPAHQLPPGATKW